MQWMKTANAPYYRLKQTLPKLPLFPEHKDPTDGIIIAQAITEKTPIISCDRKFHDYRKYGLKFVFNKR